MPDFLGIFSLSVIYGFTVCSLSCLPTLGIYLMGTGHTFRDGLVGGLYFVAGKLLVYGTWGGVAALLGRMIDISILQGKWMGLFVILAALAMPLTAYSKTKAPCDCKQSRQQGGRLPLLMLGASTSLVPCPPLAAVLLLAAHKGSVMTGISYGLLFGSGLLISPLVAAGGSMALISGVIRRKVTWIGPYLQGCAVAVLLIMGLRIFFEV
ncbi:MAG: urease accessory protein UreH domain-containing protein [Desulfobulbales bacterium]